jgi:hypothetical protein
MMMAWTASFQTRALPASLNLQMKAQRLIARAKTGIVASRIGVVAVTGDGTVREQIGMRLSQRQALTFRFYRPRLVSLQIPLLI